MPKAEKAKKEPKPKVEKPKKEKKEKKEKKAKDPNAPKRAQGAYMFFCKDKREEIKTQHPGEGVAVIGAALGKAWKELDDNEKKPYQAQAEKDKARYAKEMAAYSSKGKADKDDDGDAGEEDGDEEDEEDD